MGTALTNTYSERCISFLSIHKSYNFDDNDQQICLGRGVLVQNNSTTTFTSSTTINKNKNISFFACTSTLWLYASLKYTSNYSKQFQPNKQLYMPLIYFQTKTIKICIFLYLLGLVFVSMISNHQRFELLFQKEKKFFLLLKKGHVHLKNCFILYNLYLRKS